MRSAAPALNLSRMCFWPLSAHFVRVHAFKPCSGVAVAEQAVLIPTCILVSLLRASGRAPTPPATRGEMRAQGVEDLIHRGLSLIDFWPTGHGSMALRPAGCACMLPHTNRGGSTPETSGASHRYSQVVVRGEHARATSTACAAHGPGWRVDQPCGERAKKESRPHCKEPTSTGKLSTLGIQAYGLPLYTPHDMCPHMVPHTRAHAQCCTQTRYKTHTTDTGPLRPRPPD